MTQSRLPRNRTAQKGRPTYARSVLVISAEAFIGLGPSIQLKRLVLNRIKWINNASTNRNIDNATNARRGSNSVQILHMLQPP